MQTQIYVKYTSPAVVDGINCCCEKLGSLTRPQHKWWPGARSPQLRTIHTQHFRDSEGTKSCTAGHRNSSSAGNVARSIIFGDSYFLLVESPIRCTKHGSSQDSLGNERPLRKGKYCAYQMENILILAFLGQSASSFLESSTEREQCGHPTTRRYC